MRQQLKHIHTSKMKTILLALVLVNLTWVQSEWAIVRLCPGAPYHEVRAENGNCAQFAEDRWRQIDCSAETVNSYVCSDAKCQNCTMEYNAPLHTCDKLTNITCQKNQPDLRELMGENYLIFARRLNCDSELLSLVASDPQCVIGPSTSLSAKCSGNQATIMSYTNPNCNGQPSSSFSMTLNQCVDGLETYCNQN